jgi:hypothetical protein
MPTRAPPCATTVRGPVSTVTPPTSWLPTSPGQRVSTSIQVPEGSLAAIGGQTARTPELSSQGDQK